jgi:hypothetical protein
MAGSAWLMEYRVVEDRYASGYPLGQIEFGVYTRDADTPRHWLAGHTSNVAYQSDNTHFFDVTTNVGYTTVSGRQAVTWDAPPEGEVGASVHDTAFFYSTAYVFRLDWWSKDTITTDATFPTALAADAGQMLATFHG